MMKSHGWKHTAVLLFLAATAIVSPAQTFTAIHSFNGNGASPFAGLVLATDGNLYGTTTAGGAYFAGTVFKITPTGRLTTIYSFCPNKYDCSDGLLPDGKLVQATDGNLYGTTLHGGPDEWGTIFKITPEGTLTTLHTFDYSDGGFPNAGLMQATDGNLYGSSSGAGTYNWGTIFRMNLDGTLATLYNFCSQMNCSDGSEPQAALLQAKEGNLYGTTTRGGAHGSGTIFKISLGGTLTTLYSFCAQTNCTDGAYPYTGLVQSNDGSLYGTTGQGGAYNNGTVFKISPTGTLTTLYEFCAQTNCADGSFPYGLVLATDGNLYGTTGGGGIHGDGTLFRITLSGTLRTLSFDGNDGEEPIANLMQATNGNFYGTTYSGGAYNQGTVFQLSIGLAPFVETLPISGKVGAIVDILGTNLTGATSVSFNGTAATFTVVSASEITTTVPSGATTGILTVTTPSGTLNSNVVFRVRQ